MRKRVVFNLFLMMMFCVWITQAQTVDEVINKHITAMGGEEKLKSIKTLKMTGTLSVQGFDVGIVTTISQGIGSRTDISVPGMGDGFQIMTPTKGWGFMPFQGQTAPEEVSEVQVKSGQSQLDLQSSLLNYKEKGNKVELLGKEKTEGQDCFKLKLTNKFGKESILYIATTSYYRIKTTGKGEVNGVETDLETIYGDFRTNKDGCVFAYSQTTQSGTIVYSTIEINIPVDEKIFQVAK